MTVKPAKKNAPAEMYLLGDIGDAIGGFNADTVIDALKGVPTGAALEVFINSRGGIVSDGIAIYNLLKQYQVTLHVIGLAASAASVVAMAGNRRVMHKGAMLMIHRASGVTLGNASAHEQTLDALKKVDEQILGIYAAATGKTAEDLRPMMEAETLFSGREAVDVGFMTECEEEDEPEEQDSIMASNAAFVAIKAWRVGEIAACALYPVPSKAEKGLNPMSENEEVVNGKPEQATPQPPVASIAEIRAACKGATAEFVLSLAEKNPTMDQVRLAWIDEQSAQISALKERMEQSPVFSNGVPAIEGNTKIATNQSVDVVSAWTARTQEYRAKFKDNAVAIRELRKDEPQMYKDYIEAINKTPMKG